MANFKFRFDEKVEPKINEIYNTITSIIDAKDFECEYEEDMISGSMNDVICDLINLKNSIEIYRSQK